MYRYDPSTNILKIQRIPEKDIELAMVDYQLASYDKFCKHTIFDLLKSFVDAFAKVVQHNVTIEKNTAVEEARQLPNNFYMDYEPTSTWTTEIRTLPDRYVPIMARLNIDGAVYDVEMFRLPKMDADAVLNVRGERRVCCTRLVAADGISYDSAKASIGLSVPVRNMRIEFRKTGGATLRYNRSSIDLLDILAIYCVNENVDVDIMETFTSAYIRSWYAPSIGKAYQAVASKHASKKIYETYHSPVWNLGPAARDSLNRALSLDRAENRVLSRDLYGADGAKIAEKGEVVNRKTIREAKRHRVTAMYVKATPDAVGYKVRTPSGVFVCDVIPLGTVLPSFLSNQLPEQLKGMPSTARTVFFHGVGADVSKYGDPHELHLATDPIVIGTDRPLDADTIQFLGDCGFRTLTVSRSQDVWFDVGFEESIVCNQTAMLSEVMSPVEIQASGRRADEWVCYANNPNFESTEEENNFLNVWDWVGFVGLVDYINRHHNTHGIVNKDEGMLKRVQGPNELFTWAFEKVVPEVCTKYKSGWTRDANDPSSMGPSFDGLHIAWRKKLWDSNILRPASYQNPSMHMQQVNLIDTSAGMKEVPDAMRMLATGYYGRIDPYETPMGKSIGLSNVRAMGSRIDVDTGIIKTGYLPVIKQSDGSCRIEPNANIRWLSAQEEVEYRIGDKLSLQFNADGVSFRNTPVVARVPDGRGGHTFETINAHDLQLVNYHSCQHISPATALIPFVGANEAARLTLGTGMIKQSILVQYNEKPRMFTSIYRQMFEHTPTYCEHAKESGFVVDISQSGVTIARPRPDSGIREGHNFVGQDVTDLLSACDGMPSRKYNIDPTLITRQGLNIINWRVEVGQWVNEGDPVYDSSIAPDGIYSPGCNFFAAYVPNGYNYEDAVEISESAASRFTSITMETVSINLGIKSLSAPTCAANTRLYIPENGVIATFEINRPSGHKIRKDITSGIHSGILLGVAHDRTELKHYSKYLAHFIAFNRLRTGDKLIGRHSNKGTASVVQKNSDMPRFKNGIPVDVTLNPMGVPSRLNIGQNFEAWLNFVAYLLDIYIESDSFNGATSSDVAELMEFVWEIANSTDPKSAVSKFTNLPVEIREIGVRRYPEIRKWAGCFNKDGTADLINPKSGKPFPVPVTFGMPYMLKLEHEVNKKLKMRAGELDGEEYSAIYQQPVEGAARGGGERVGEMEVCAYAAYGANELLRETINEDSDNMAERLYSAMEDAGLAGNVHLEGDGYFSRMAAVPHSVEHFRYLLEALGIDLCADFLPPCDIETSERRALPDRRSIIRNSSVTSASQDNDDIYGLFEE